MAACKRKNWFFFAALSAGLAAAFVLFGGFGLGYTPRTVMALALCGALLGGISAPELEPEAFRHPVLWQSGFGAAGGVVVAWALSASFPGYFVGLVAGGILGALARHWIDHIQIP